MGFFTSNQDRNAQGQAVGSSEFDEYKETIDLGFLSTVTTLEDDPRFGSLVKNPKSRITQVLGLPYNNVYRTESISRNISYVEGTGPFNVNEIRTQNSFQIDAGSATVNSSEIYKGPENSLETSTSPSNRQKIFFDAKERPIKITSSGELDTHFSYNNFGQLTGVRKGSAQSSFSYDSNGQLSQVTNPAGHTVQYERDANGLVKKQTLPNGEFTEFSYTPSKRLKRIKTSSGNVHEFEMSFLDKVISYLPPAISGNNENTYEYDVDGRILRVTKPSLGTATYYYKSGTNFIERISTPSGDYQFNQLDAYGRPSEFISPDGIRTVVTWVGQEISSFKQYDGSLMIGGMIVYRTNVFGIRNLSIDAFDNVEYQYDSDMRMTKAGDETYSYSINNSQESGGTPESASINITSSSPHNSFRRSISYSQTGGGSVDGINYSKRNYYSVSHTPTGKTFTVDSLKDSSGNIIRVSSQKSGSNTSFDYYQYDVNGRLKSSNGRISSNYEFGLNNNISKYTHGDKVTRAVYDSQDRLLSLHGSIERNFSYDESGNLQKISNCLGEKTFEYDFFGNLKKVVLPNGKVIQYKYDAFNRRVARLENGAVKNYYVWQDSTRLTSILKPNGTLAVGYVYGIHPVAPIYFTVPHPTQGLKKYTVVANDRGDIRYAIDSNGEIAQEIEYDEYGMILSDSSVASAGVEPLQPLGFVSGLTDRETGLTRFGARDYDPVIGRWTAKDPVLFDGNDTNLYSYVGANPINWIDKTGLARCTYSISTGRLSCTSNDGKTSAGADMYSGRRGRTNNPDATNSSGGPIPTGKYDIRKTPTSLDRDWFLDPGLLSRIGYKLGQNRGAFNLHLRPGGSDGCITATGGENDANLKAIDDMLNMDAGNNTVEVGF